MNILNLQTGILISALETLVGPTVISDYLSGEGFNEEQQDMLMIKDPMILQNKELASTKEDYPDIMNFCAKSVLTVELTSEDQVTELLKLVSVNKSSDYLICNLIKFNEYEESNITVESLTHAINLISASEIHFKF